jgi:hypothetical protein
MLVFNWRYYLKANPDVWNAGYRTRDQAIQHWRSWGAAECRVAHPLFHSRQYLDQYADVRNAFSGSCRAGTIHFVRNGLAEGRSGIWGGKPYQPVFHARTPTSHLSWLGGREYIFRLQQGQGTALPHDDVANP